MSLRFHWMLPGGGEVGMKTAQESSRVLTTKKESLCALTDMDGWCKFARSAEEAGIEGVLQSFSRYGPDTFQVACALGLATRKLKFISAYRSGLMQPTTFVQQVNTLSGLIGGRISLNIVAGNSTAEQRGYGDYLEHDERYARTEEFLSICREFWRNNGSVDFTGSYFRVKSGRLLTRFESPNRTAPEVYVAGHSDQAERLALSRADCWVRLIDTVGNLQDLVSRTRERSVEVCLRLAIICRPTRKEAIKAAQVMLPDKSIEKEERRILTGSDSKVLHWALDKADNVGWMNSNLWAGLVPYYGSSAITLLGSPQELADAFLEYKRIGVTQFIISGWPTYDEMVIFGREVLPLVRAAEQN